MVKRLFDIFFSFIGLAFLSPLFLIVALAIGLTSRGSFLYLAKRVGLDGEVFTMHKFRTMHVSHGTSSMAITGATDQRVFGLGRWLRRLKIDELPQFWDVLRGKMSIVGPRPEDPRIVREFYTPEHLRTLRVKPGMASPGSIFNYTHGEQLLQGDEPEKVYVEKLLPMKLALENVYLEKASFFYDLRIILRTFCVILAAGLGKKNFKPTSEMRCIKNSMRSRDTARVKNFDTKVM